MAAFGTKQKIPPFSGRICNKVARGAINSKPIYRAGAGRFIARGFSQHREYSPFALALWSKQPLAVCEVRMIGDYPYIRAQTADGTALYTLHPPPPISSELAGARQHYLAETARALAAEPRTLAVGDFNSSPFSPLFARFLQESSSRPATRYFTPTWQPFFLNIDHALAKGLNVSARTLPWQHSDHRPLLVEYTGQ